MLSTRIAIAMICLGFLASACVIKSDGREWVRDAASRDLQCPGGKLTIHHYTKTPHHKGATGCGKTAKYDEVCDGKYCRWKRVGEIRPAGAPPPPPPPPQ